MTEEKEKKKVVALLSGGLDSQLAVRMMQEQGFSSDRWLVVKRIPQDRGAAVHRPHGPQFSSLRELKRA